LYIHFLSLYIPRDPVFPAVPENIETNEAKLGIARGREDSYGATGKLVRQTGSTSVAKWEKVGKSVKKPQQAEENPLGERRRGYYGGLVRRP